MGANCFMKPLMNTNKHELKYSISVYLCEFVVTNREG
jgi:hypothetical protein